MLSRQQKVFVKHGYNYLIFLPKDYVSSERWPLILFLHGAGEKGTDLDRLKNTALPQRLEELEDFPFVVISPQCPPGFYWSTKLVGGLIDMALELYKIDENRIYLTGISMGGYGTWDTAIENPTKFAAIAPICGGGNPMLASRIKHLAIWIFHGAQDRIVPVGESKVMATALGNLGGDVRLTIYPNAGHDSWTETYRNPELYDWFLSHSRRPCSECPEVYGENRSEQRPEA